MVNQIQGTGPMQGADRHFKSTPLTDDQKNQIQTILSRYDSKNVSASDAKKIFQEFRDAGIKPARGMKETIEAAGFDADALREMGRPEGATTHQAHGTGTTAASSALNLSALKSLQTLLSQFDLTNLSEQDQSSLTSSLQDQGFLNSGSTIDLKS
jgi:hypothetical protein